MKGTLVNLHYPMLQCWGRAEDLRHTDIMTYDLSIICHWLIRIILERYMSIHLPTPSMSCLAPRGASHCHERYWSLGESHESHRTWRIPEVGSKWLGTVVCSPQLEVWMRVETDWQIGMCALLMKRQTQADSLQQWGYTWVPETRCLSKCVCVSLFAILCLLCPPSTTYVCWCLLHLFACLFLFVQISNIT